jgi:hypothetical protein
LLLSTGFRISTKAHGVLRTFGGFILVPSIHTDPHHLFATKASIDRLMKLQYPINAHYGIVASMEQKEGGRRKRMESQQLLSLTR